MSKVSSWVKAVDGYWYKNPIIEGVTEVGHRWFICFDDEDPPEFVYEIGETQGFRIPLPMILENIGIKINSHFKARESGRLFGNDPEFSKARGYFLNIVDLIPVPNRFDDVQTMRPKTLQGAFYDFSNYSRKDVE